MSKQPVNLTVSRVIDAPADIIYDVRDIVLPRQQVERG